MKSQNADNVICVDCRYFTQLGKLDGNCRIEPPRVNPIHPNKLGVFPIVGDGDWCGKGERRVPKPGQPEPVVAALNQDEIRSIVEHVGHAVNIDQLAWDTLQLTFAYLTKAIKEKATA